MVTKFWGWQGSSSAHKGGDKQPVHPTERQVTLLKVLGSQESFAASGLGRAQPP